MIRNAVILSASILVTAHVSASSDTYALNTGEAGAQRLDVQSAHIHKESCDHLDKAGLKKGHIVYDVACGNGYMTKYIASFIGPEGHVYAIDVSSAQLELAKKRIQEAGLTNVTFIQANILNDSKLDIPPADLVYSRFLLMHLPDPNLAIQNMLGFLKSNGALALHEPITSAIHVHGDSDQLQGFKKAILELGSHLGLDYEIGFRLKILAEENGLKDVRQDEHQHILDPELARNLLMLAIKDWGVRVLQEKIISKDELAAIEEEIRQLNKPFAISKNIYITGKKL